MMEWVSRLIGAGALVILGTLLTYWWMLRRLDNDVAAARHCGDVLLIEQRQRHEQKFNQLISDYNNCSNDRRQAVILCEQLARDIERRTAENQSLIRGIAQLTTENDVLRERLAKVSWEVNAWEAKTERGQA